MELAISTPAMLFPAITLLMLAYTNRFLGLASLVRSLGTRHQTEENKQIIIKQIQNVRIRLRLIRAMQAFGVGSFMFTVLCMYTIFLQEHTLSHQFFAASLISLFVSLLLSLIEIWISTAAIEAELRGIGIVTTKSFIKHIISPNEDENNTL